MATLVEMTDEEVFGRPRVTESISRESGYVCSMASTLPCYLPILLYWLQLRRAWHLFLQKKHSNFADYAVGCWIVVIFPPMESLPRHTDHGGQHTHMGRG